MTCDLWTGYKFLSGQGIEQAIELFSLDFDSSYLRNSCYFYAKRQKNERIEK